MSAQNDVTASRARGGSRMFARDWRPRHVWVLSALLASTTVGLPGMGTPEVEARCRHLAAGSG